MLAANKHAAIQCGHGALVDEVSHPYREPLQAQAPVWQAAAQACLRSACNSQLQTRKPRNASLGVCGRLSTAGELASMRGRPPSVAI